MTGHPVGYWVKARCFRSLLMAWVKQWEVAQVLGPLPAMLETWQKLLARAGPSPAAAHPGLAEGLESWTPCNTAWAELLAPGLGLV